MNKINGYTKEEAKSLIEYIWEGKKAGKTLTTLFSSYGKKSGRAKGSVRNYYYALMKKGEEREVQSLLKGKNLTVEKIREFTEEETDEAIKQILMEKSKGVSVRRAICNLSKGDDKLMLRLQNKYRNVLKKEPERIQTIARQLGLQEIEERSLEKKLEEEINALYERLTKSLKAENTRLFEENERLKKENERLKTFSILR